MTPSSTTADSKTEGVTAAPVVAPLVGLLIAGPAARERVAGVELARRAAIVLRRSGCARVLVRATAEVLDALRGDPRSAIEAAPDPLPAAERVVVVAGDIDVTVAGLAQLATRAGAGGSALAGGDAGFALVAPASVAASVVGGPSATLAEVAARSRAQAPAATVESIRPAATRTERRAASRAILRATGKAVDGPLTRLFERRISQGISGLLLALPVSPNFMTTVSCAIGLSGAGLLATTGYGLRILGAALFVFATIVDGCDGEIARSKFLESSFGRLYDTAVDIVVNAAVFLGIGIGTWRELDGVSEVRTATLLLVGGGVLAMAVVESVRRLLLAPAAAPGTPPVPAPGVPPAASPGILERAQAWLEWFATVEWCYLVLGLAILDQIPFFFFGAAVGANVFAAVYLALGVVAWRRA